MKVWPLYLMLAILFATGAVYAFFAQRNRDYLIRQLNSPWYIPVVRGSGVFMMIIALVGAAIVLVNSGFDVVWPLLEP